MIKWNEYTWYSKLAAIIFFMAVLPVWTFFIGMRYQETRDLLSKSAGDIYIPVVQHQNIIKPATNNASSTSLSDEQIISSIEKAEHVKLTKDSNGVYNGPVEGGIFIFSVNTIAKGDLNEDGLEDAYVWGTSCGGSCGSGFTLILGHLRGPLFLKPQPPDFIGAGAGQYSIESMVIEDGIITIVADTHDYTGGNSKLITLRYVLDGGKLVRI